VFDGLPACRLASLLAVYILQLNAQCWNIAAAEGLIDERLAYVHSWTTPVVRVCVTQKVHLIACRQELWSINSDAFFIALWRQKYNVA